MGLRGDKEILAEKAVDVLDSLVGVESALVLTMYDKDKIYALILELLKEKSPARQSIKLWREMAHAWVDGAELEYWDLSTEANTVEWQDSWKGEFFAYDEMVVYRIKDVDAHEEVRNHVDNSANSPFGSDFF